MTRITSVGLLLLVASATAATQGRPASRGTGVAMDCKACHTSPTPTKNTPALSACPRLKITGYHAVDEAPGTFTLSTSSKTYGPVQFPHREHAHMAETGKGCAGCHHYDQARPIQKCKNCHAVSRKREELGKPDLKAALHRQCIECHREWNPTGTCSTCHAKAGVVVATKTKVTTPDRIIYETHAKQGQSVTFFHKDHTDRFGLACADCHQQESCGACHDRKRAALGQAAITRQTAAGLTEEQAHERCANCHTTDACATCHKGMASRALAFDHGRRTGFTLNRFHARLDCKQCHKTAGTYARLGTDCESCHKGWQAKFNHAHAGLVLDEQHQEIECASCHEDKTFRAKPVCASCHDDKAWPAQKPGKPVAREAAKK
ncbi:MAG TPA: cytochrome c3 family protein [Gemmatimonadaceae bacterium]|jgi:hypothetical protein